MHVTTTDFKSATAETDFTQSLKETGFGVITNHPIDMALVDKVYQDWAQFFASEQKNDYPAYVDVKDVNKSDYRYPGPSPRSKETAIVMLADTIDNATGPLAINYQAADLWPEVNVDIEKINQGLSALFSNAGKYSPDNNEVECIASIVSADEARYFEISITDHGIGISENDLARVGHPFFRTDDSHSIPGNGLGLAIAKEILAIHNGQLIISSTHRKGTTVQVRLPIVS